MQPVLERGSIDKPLSFDVGLIQLRFIPVCSPNTCRIAPTVCTLVLFIIASKLSLLWARARARVREWKTEIGKWKSETRSGIASIGHGRKKKNAKSRFFYFARRVRRLALYSDVIHLFDWKSAVEYDSTV